MTDPSEMSRVDLEEEVAWLREQLGIRSDQRMRIVKRFKVSRCKAAVLSAMISANGAPVLASFLDEIIPTDKERVSDCVRTYICMLRRAIGWGAIESVRTTRGSAYALTPLGLETCERVLSA